MLAIRIQEIVSIPHAKLDTVQAQPPQRRHAFGLPGQMHAIAQLDNLDRASIEMLEALNQLILIAPRRLGDLAENSARELQRYGAAAERDEKAELNFPEIRDILIKEMRSDLAEPDSDDNGEGCNSTVHIP